MRVKDQQRAGVPLHLVRAVEAGPAGPSPAAAVLAPAPLILGSP
jgi:hypothetical protein